MTTAFIISLIVIIVLVAMVIILFDKTEAKNSQKTGATIEWIQQFYSETTFPLDNPLTSTQFRAIKETINLLIQHEHFQYNRIPDTFDEYTSDEVKLLAKLRKTNHLENHHKWRHIYNYVTKLTLDSHILAELNELMQNNPEFVLQLWGIPGDSPVELQTDMLAEIRKIETGEISIMDKMKAETPTVEPVVVQAEEVPTVQSVSVETTEEPVKAKKPRIYTRS